VLLHGCVIGLARRFLDQPAQDAVAEIGIGIALARIEIELLLRHVPDDVSRPSGRLDALILGDDNGAEHRIEGDRAIPARRVVQKLANGDLAQPGIAVGGQRDLEHVERVVVEPDEAEFDEAQDHGGRNRLGDAGDAKAHGGFDRQAGLGVGMPEAARIDEPAVLRHGQGSAGDLVVLHELEHHLIEAGKLGIGFPGDGSLFFLPACKHGSQQQNGRTCVGSNEGAHDLSLENSLGLLP